MKIVCWNLKNISQNKISNKGKYKFSPTFISYGLGNSILDYIIRVVTGNAQWDVIPNLSTNPADIFVIIELKTPGSKYDKGKPVSGNCLPTLKKILSGMNEVKDLDTTKYVYEYVTPPGNENPMITGFTETVGIIYNTKTLTYKTGCVLYDLDKTTLTSKVYLQNKTPYAAQFEFVASPGTFMQVIGIHAPPTSAPGNYRDPIQFCRLLPGVGNLWTNYAEMANTLFMGDFNCNAGSSYPGYVMGGNGAKRQKTSTTIYPFTGLEDLKYETHLESTDLSSVKKKIAAQTKPPFTSSDYLSDAYDNIIMNGPAGALASTAKEIVVDTIGYTRDMNDPTKPNLVNNDKADIATANCVVKAFNQVSDHLPVVIEW